jgi:Glycosyltransferase family 25 (LPS biosynthesis protein)
MFASDSWTPSRRRTYSSSTPPEENGLHEAHSEDKPIVSSSSSFYIHRLSHNLYLRYFLSLLLGIFIGRTILAPLDLSFYSIPLTHIQVNAPTASKAPPLDPHYTNATLGTAAIIALNQPSRPDRRDYLAIMASLSNLKLTHLDAWTSKPISKALPSEHNPNLKDGEYACWRSHADAWRLVIEEGWDTAMIIEDDADWDVGIRESMAAAWKGLIEITNDPHAATAPTSLALIRNS